ncbi:MAG: hypothetical protein EBR82_35370 [Caulobacteraceae bacterium]|nr:hypothetical protein [Caulobacteraceae bacterium]
MGNKMPTYDELMGYFRKYTGGQNPQIASNPDPGYAASPSWNLPANQAPWWAQQQPPQQKQPAQMMQYTQPMPQTQNDPGQQQPMSFEEFVRSKMMK